MSPAPQAVQAPPSSGSNWNDGEDEPQALVMKAKQQSIAAATMAFKVGSLVSQCIYWFNYYARNIVVPRAIDAS